MNCSALQPPAAQDARAYAWSSLLALTHQMLDAARIGEWERVRLLEPDRRRHLESFFAAAVAADEVRSVREGIIDILESDRELLRLRDGYAPEPPANVVPFRPRGLAARA